MLTRTECRDRATDYEAQALQTEQITRGLPRAGISNQVSNLYAKAQLYATMALDQDRDP